MVVLPAPFLPRSPNAFPLSAEKDISFNTFLSPKDFAGLPYTFYYGDTIPPTTAAAITDKSGNIVLMVLASNEKAGPKFYNKNSVKYAIYIDDRLKPVEYEAD